MKPFCIQLDALDACLAVACRLPGVANAHDGHFHDRGVALCLFRVVHFDQALSFCVNCDVIQHCLIKTHARAIGPQVYLVNRKCVTFRALSTDQTDEVLEAVCAEVGVEPDLTYVDAFVSFLPSFSSCRFDTDSAGAQDRDSHTLH